MTESSANPPSIRAVLYLRKRASPETVQQLKRIVDRVRRLETDGIAEVAVETWTSVTPALEELGDSGPSISLTVNSFRAWASGEGYTLEPSFDRRETGSMLDGRSAVQIRVPIVSLAVYESDTLRCVAPCSDGERTYSVEQCLAALEVGFTEPFAFRDRFGPVGEDSMENGH
ncbi:HTH domain-containing protein [Natronorubrum texcoconense]|uniref:Uncharacterized protein n=1 Tax=Natronorubrum texcoconense TaxID=1095776 RepID=A0A1G8X5H4_9EURY|nr:HTH domain-containing protein [Natronorubrum texcoconense]SDJ85868.1 hypothetical protein SAMN04515672_1627 [Natronorubrum texcoconense]